MSPLSGLFFEYSIGPYDLSLFDALGPPRSNGAAGGKLRPRREVVRDVWAFARKAARKGFVEYVF